MDNSLGEATAGRRGWCEYPPDSLQRLRMGVNGVVIMYAPLRRRKNDGVDCARQSSGEEEAMS